MVRAYATPVEKRTLSQRRPATSVKPHPSNKTDDHEQSTDIIYGKVRSYTNPIKTWDSLAHAQTVCTGPSPRFWWAVIMGWSKCMIACTPRYR